MLLARWLAGSPVTFLRHPFFILLLGTLGLERPLRADDLYALQKCSQEIRALGAQPSAIYKVLLSKFSQSDSKEVSRWIQSVTADFAQGKFEEIFTEGQRRHLVLSLGALLKRSDGTVREGVQIDAARAIKRLMLSGFVTHSETRLPLRAQLWEALEDCPYDGGKDSTTFCSLLHDALIFSYPANELSHPDLVVRYEAALNQVSSERPRDENIEALNRISRFYDYLIISPLEHDYLKGRLINLLNRIDRREQTEVWNRLQLMLDELERQSSVALSATRALGRRGLEETRLLLGESLYHREQELSLHVRPGSLEDRQRRALDLMGLLSTDPRYTRLYMDSFLRLVENLMPHDPLRAQGYLKRVSKDIQQSLSRQDLRSDERSALTISLSRLEQFWRPSASRPSN